jgi:hypothetical protein
MEHTMIRMITMSLLAVLLGGCVVVPAGYVSYDNGYHRHGYYYRDYGPYPRYYSYGYRGYYSDHGQ